MEDAERLHKEAIIIDGHCDTILTVTGRGFMGQRPRDFFARGDTGMIDLPRLKEGGVTCQVMAAYIEDHYKPARSARRALELLDALHALVESSEELMLATRAADIEAAKAADKVAFLLSIEGGEAVEGSLALLRGFYKLGVRAMGLTWNQRNDIADGVGERSGGSGLTDFGVSVVKEMERLGMLVDVSHLSDASFWSLDKVAERPYIASHSNARALASHRRNLTDQQIEALAKKGGVIGVVFAPGFVDDNPDNVSLARLCDHIDHIKSIGGIDCVALGSDFDGYTPVPGKPVVMKDVSELPALTAELLSRGYTEEEVKKVLGGNWLRVYREVIG
ncbi:MAG TPA: membrane dipeptidase [Firmicutes bacterium]|mgnify:CR=1 FL=1|nr:membrane dipeptidase [Candidatus Fermentithermobacillaceae bacterium]